MPPLLSTTRFLRAWVVHCHTRQSGPSSAVPGKRTGSAPPEQVTFLSTLAGSGLRAEQGGTEPTEAGGAGCAPRQESFSASRPWVAPSTRALRSASPGPSWLAPRPWDPCRKECGKEDQLTAVGCLPVHSAGDHEQHHGLGCVAAPHPD